MVISDEYLDSDACDFQTKFALSLSPGEFHFCQFESYNFPFFLTFATVHACKFTFFKKNK